MKKRKSITQEACPCGSQRAYEDCCMRWHEGEQRLQAPDAEKLMRSRYSAYVLKLNDYIQETWHPSTRPSLLDKYDASSKWMGLTVHAHEQQDDTHATVEFTARYSVGGKADRMHEVSRFEKINGIWYYLDGDVN